jgi:hypothetical protein
MPFTRSRRPLLFLVAAGLVTISILLASAWLAFGGSDDRVEDRLSPRETLLAEGKWLPTTPLAGSGALSASRRAIGGLWFRQDDTLVVNACRTDIYDLSWESSSRFVVTGRGRPDGPVPLPGCSEDVDPHSVLPLSVGSVVALRHGDLETIVMEGPDAQWALEVEPHTSS